MLVLVPIMVVVNEGSEETMSPFKDHVIFSGSSPELIEQVTWTNFPSSIDSKPKLNGIISGGSEKKDYSIFIGKLKM